MAPLRLITPAGGNTFVSVSEPKNSAFQIRVNESAELQVAICGVCGYAEQYVEDVARLWKYWQKGYR